MRIYKLIITICFLFIGTTLSDENTQIIENKPIIEEKLLIEREEIKEEDIINEEIVEETIKPISNDKKESTKKDNKEKQKTTIKKKSKLKTDNVKSKEKNNKKEKSESVKPKEEVKKEEVKEEKKQKEEIIEEPKKEESKPQCSDFYDSITQGKIDKSSKDACVSYGDKIQNNELDAVIDYNREHGNVKKPAISYFRCYEVVDKNCNTKGWYLHFFCNSNECDDNKIKSLYG